MEVRGSWDCGCGRRNHGLRESCVACGSSRASGLDVYDYRSSSASTPRAQRRGLSFRDYLSLAVIAAALGGYAYLTAGAELPGQAQGSYLRHVATVRHGMSDAQVRDLCGPPDEIRIRPSAQLPIATSARRIEVWSYDNGGALLTFGDGELIAIRRN
ncbi:MAG: hypothetical protein ACK47B_16625 [Armatimonadota bacterium]